MVGERARRPGEGRPAAAAARRLLIHYSSGTREWCGWGRAASCRERGMVFSGDRAARSRERTRSAPGTGEGACPDRGKSVPGRGKGARPGEGKERTRESGEMPGDGKERAREREWSAPGRVEGAPLKHPVSTTVTSRPLVRLRLRLRLRKQVYERTFNIEGYFYSSSMFFFVKMFENCDHFACKTKSLIFYHQNSCFKAS